MSNITALLAAEDEKKTPHRFNHSITLTKDQKSFVAQAIGALGPKEVAKEIRKAMLSGLSAALERKQKPKKT